MFEAGFGRSHGWRRPKCRLRRSVRPVGRDEGTREAGGLPGGRLLVLFAKESGSFKSHSPQPEGRVKSLRGQGPRVLHGEAMPSKRWIAFRQRNDISTPHPGPLPQGERDLSEGCRGFGKPQTKTAALSCGFYFYSPNMPSSQPKNYFPNPLHCSPPAAG